MNRIQRNLSVRAKMKQSGVTQWMLSDYFHVHENTIARQLRHELPDADRERYLAAIDEIAREMNGERSGDA